MGRQRAEIAADVIFIFVVLNGSHWVIGWNCVELKVYQTGKGGEGIDTATFGYYFHSGYDNAYYICTYLERKQY